MSAFPAAARPLAIALREAISPAAEMLPVPTRKVRVMSRVFDADVMVLSNAAFGPLTKSRWPNVRDRARLLAEAEVERLAGSCEEEGIGECGNLWTRGARSCARLEPRFP